MANPQYRSVGKGQYLKLLATFLLSSMLSGVLLAGLALPVAGVGGIIAKSGPRVFETLPADFDILPPSELSVIQDRNGTPIASMYAEKRIIVALDSISQHLRDAIVSVEDRRFYEHKGIDPDGMMRAALHNLGGSSTQGASTLTQQYVKNTLLESGIQKGDQELIDSATEQTVQRKLREARYALALEQKMTKDEILAGYLNVAPFGPNVYGAEAASQLYFSKSAADLTIGEAALMAGIVKSPNEYDPLTHPEAAQARRDIVLSTMLAEGKITQAEYDETRATNIEDYLHVKDTPQGCAGAASAAYFCDYVREVLLSSDQFGATRLERQQKLLRGGLTLKTSLDLNMQAKAVEAIQASVPTNDPSGVNAVIVSRSPRTGEILAMAQNTNYGVPTESDPSATQNSYAVDTAHGGGAGFPAGSTLKPFTMLEWFKEGRSAWETVGNHPRDFQPNEWNTCAPEYATEVWPVGDIEGKAGNYNIIQATEYSVNRAYAHMASKVELCGIFDGMKALGITGPDGGRVAPIPSKIIAAEATPLAMAGAYGAFVTSGQLCQPLALTEVLDRNGESLVKFEPQCSQAVDATAAQKVAAVLHRVADSSSYYAANIGRPIIAKTGTSDDNANAWLVGGTPQIITAAWIGYAKSSSKSLNFQTIGGVYYDWVYGGTLAAPMWSRYMSSAMEGMEVEGIPEASLGSPPVQRSGTSTPKPTADTGGEKPEEKND